MTKSHKVKFRKPSKKIIIVIGSTLLLIGALFTSLYLYNNHRYNSVFAEVNGDTVESMIISSEESKEYKKLVKVIQSVNEDGILEDSSLNEADRLSSQIAERLSKQCANYEDAFVMSDDVPQSFFDIAMLSNEQKDDLAKLADSLKIQERKYCTEAKAAAGLVLLTYEAVAANANWYAVYSSTYTDSEAIDALKKFSDGTYEAKYQNEMGKVYGDAFENQIDGFINLYATAYDYSIETDESMYSAKWDKLTIAQNEYSASPLSPGTSEAYEQYARTSLKDALDFYEIVSTVGEKNPERFNYSSSASTAFILSSAINMHEVDLDTKPIADSSAKLVEILNEKRYLDSDLNLSLGNITYKSADGTDATLVVTVESTDKSYEIIL